MTASTLAERDAPGTAAAGGAKGRQATWWGSREKPKRFLDGSSHSRRAVTWVGLKCEAQGGARLKPKGDWGFWFGK